MPDGRASAVRRLAHRPSGGGGTKVAEGTAGPEDPAFFCYRFRASRHVDEWWATTGSGATAYLAGVGGATQDVGVFDGSVFD